LNDVEYQSQVFADMAIAKEYNMTYEEFEALPAHRQDLYRYHSIMMYKKQKHEMKKNKGS